MGEPGTWVSFGQLEVPGRTAQLLKDEGGAPGHPEHWAAEPQRLLTACSHLHPSYKLGTGLGRRLGWEWDHRRPPEDFSWRGREGGGGISDRLSGSKGHSVGSLSAFRVLLECQRTDTSEITPAPQLSSVCKQGVKSTGEVGVVHSDQGWEEKLGRGGGRVRGRRAFRSCRERGEEWDRRGLRGSYRLFVQQSWV